VWFSAGPYSQKNVSGGEALPQEVLSTEARSAGAPRGWDLGRGAVTLPAWGLGAMPPKNIPKINVEIAYFSAFLCRR